MPYEFLGTFNKSQFERLAAYARDQLPTVQARILHLSAEVTRIGVITQATDSAGRPVGYTATPKNSYLGRLIGAYEILGGDVFMDLQTRAMADPVYLKKGTETAVPKVFSNGEPVPQAGLADAATADLVQTLKAWIVDISDRRARLERKIRRAIDYADQLNEEIAVLKNITATVDTPKSLESIIAAVQIYLADPTYRATLDDKGKDPYGKFAKAPLSSYEPGGEREAPEGEGVEKTSDGYYIYGADTSTGTG